MEVGERERVQNIKYNFQNIFRFRQPSFLFFFFFLRLTRWRLLFSFKELPLSYFLYTCLARETTGKKFELLRYLYLRKSCNSDLS